MSSGPKEIEKRNTSVDYAQISSIGDLANRLSRQTSNVESRAGLITNNTTSVLQHLKTEPIVEYDEQIRIIGSKNDQKDRKEDKLLCSKVKSKVKYASI